MRQSLRTVLSLFLAGLLLVSCGTSEKPSDSESPSDTQSTEDVTVVNFGHVPSISASEKLAQLKPLKKYLESELPIKLKIQFAESYGEVIKQMEQGTYDFVTFGPLSYVEAAEGGNITASLKPIRFGKTHYRSIIFTNKDSGIDEIKDLKGKRFAFVDKKSTSGYLFPSAYLKKQGVDPDSDLSGYSFMGSHSNVVVGVWLEKYAAGAVYDDARRDQDNQETIMDETKVIARTDKIPNEPWAFRTAFREKHPDLVEEIRNLMLKLNKAGPEQQRILDKLKIDGFAEATDEDYDVVREYQSFLDQ